MDIVKWFQLAVTYEASLNVIQWSSVTSYARGQVLNSEVQQSVLFTVRVCALHCRGLDNGHTVGPNLGQKLADKCSIQDQAPTGRFITQKQSWVEYFNPAPPPHARSGGDRAVLRGCNAGAGST